MQREDFIKTCTAGCLGFSLLAFLAPGCSSTSMVTGSISGDDLLIPLSEFEIISESKTSHRKFIIVHHNKLQYPIYIKRHDNDAYSAHLMRCTHQGTELQAFGDRLQCPAHGSEFDSNGNVTNGPAAKNLRNFQVTIQHDQLKISLK